MYSFVRQTDEHECKLTWYFTAIIQACRMGLEPFIGLHLQPKIKERRLYSQHSDFRRPFFGLHAFYCTNKSSFTTDYHAVTKSTPAAFDLAALQVLKEMLKMKDHQIQSFMLEWNNARFLNQGKFRADLTNQNGDKVCAICEEKSKEMNEDDLIEKNPLVNNAIYKLYNNQLKTIRRERRRNVKMEGWIDQEIGEELNDSMSEEVPSDCFCGREACQACYEDGQQMKTNEFQLQAGTSKSKFYKSSKIFEFPQKKIPTTEEIPSTSKSIDHSISQRKQDFDFFPLPSMSNMFAMMLSLVSEKKNDPYAFWERIGQQVRQIKNKQIQCESKLKSRIFSFENIESPISIPKVSKQGIPILQLSDKVKSSSSSSSRVEVSGNTRKRSRSPNEEEKDIGILLPVYPSRKKIKNRDSPTSELIEIKQDIKPLQIKNRDQNQTESSPTIPSTIIKNEVEEFDSSPSLETNSTTFVNRKRARKTSITIDENELENQKVSSPSKRSKHSTKGNENEINFSCSLCPKKFRDKRILLHHELKLHNVKISSPYKGSVRKCQDCGKEFLSLRNFTDHMNSNAGIKPHKCTECGFAFIKKSGLKRHQIRFQGGCSKRTEENNSSKA